MRKYFTRIDSLYMVLGLALVIAGQGCFSPQVKDEIREMSGLRQEFLQAKATSTTIGELSGRPNNSFQNDKVVLFDGSLMLGEDHKPKMLWLMPFATPDDALCVRFVSEKSATVEYFNQKSGQSSMYGQPVRVIFLDEPWPRLRLAGELSALDQSNKYTFIICPAKPMEHNVTVTVYGFGTWSNYEAKVENPKDCPYIHRDRSKMVHKGMNYLWTVPADIVVSPIALPVFWIWWNYFVKF